MSLKTDLEGIKTKLQNILNRSNTELTVKGANTVPNLNGLPEAIKSIKTGGGQDIEVVKGTSDNPPKFNKTNGSIELWGWGSVAGSGWLGDTVYVFEGATYKQVSRGVHSPTQMNLKINSNGIITGYPSIDSGTLLGIRR